MNKSKGMAFECFACGKCCNSPPTIFFEEAHSMAGEFPLYLSLLFSGIQSTKKLTPPKQFRLYWENQLSLRPQVFVGEREVASVSIKLNPFSYGGDSCPKLDPSGACSMHQDRPVTCRLVPFRFGELMAEQGKNLIWMKNQYGCVSYANHNDGKIIYRDGKIAGNDFPAVYSKAKQMYKNDQLLSSFICVAIESGYESWAPRFDEVRNAFASGDRLYISIVPLLFAMAAIGYPKENVLDIARKQAVLLRLLASDSQSLLLPFGDLKRCISDVEKFNRNFSSAEDLEEFNKAVGHLILDGAKEKLQKPLWR